MTFPAFQDPEDVFKAERVPVPADVLPAICLPVMMDGWEQYVQLRWLKKDSSSPDFIVKGFLYAGEKIEVTGSLKDIRHSTVSEGQTNFMALTTFDQAGEAKVTVQRRKVVQEFRYLKSGGRDPAENNLVFTLAISEYDVIPSEAGFGFTRGHSRPIFRWQYRLVSPMPVLTRSQNERKVLRQL
jgi:hypothetical protein